MNGYDSANLIYLIGFLALLLFWLVPMIRQEGFGRVAKMSLGWIGILALSHCSRSNGRASAARLIPPAVA